MFLFFSGNKILGSETGAFTTISKKKSLDDKYLHLRIEFCSNWGNDTYIGLTEVRFQFKKRQ